MHCLLLPQSAGQRRARQQLLLRFRRLPAGSTRPKTPKQPASASDAAGVRRTPCLRSPSCIVSPRGRERAASRKPPAGFDTCCYEMSAAIISLQRRRRQSRQVCGETVRKKARGTARASQPRAGRCMITPKLLMRAHRRSRPVWLACNCQRRKITKASPMTIQRLTFAPTF